LGGGDERGERGGHIGCDVAGAEPTTPERVVDDFDHRIEQQFPGLPGGEEHLLL
jgi:hypothetical protein